MSDIISNAVDLINAKLGSGFDGSIKIVINDLGALIIDETGARIGDDDADCTMTADFDTLSGMIDGTINPTSAFMGGKLSVEGDMSVAMKLGALLA